MKKLISLSIICLIMIAASVMLVSASEITSEQARQHTAEIWNAKTDFWRLQQAYQRLNAGMEHQGAIWDAKVAYYQSHAMQALNHQANVWDAKVNYYQLSDAVQVLSHQAHVWDAKVKFYESSSAMQILSR